MRNSLDVLSVVKHDVYMRLLAIKYLPYNLGVYIVATVLSIGVLFAISPIEAINKPLEEIEVKVFGKRARIVLCITLVIFGVNLCVWFDGNGKNNGNKRR